MKIVYLASAAVAAMVLGASAASASTYTLEPLPVSPSTVSVAGVVDSNASGATAKTFTDDFVFSIAANYDTTLAGLYFEQNPSKKDVITSADLTLFQGVPGVGTPVEIATSGVFSVSTTPGVQSASIDALLKPNVEYFVQSEVTVPKGDIGDFSISATASPVSAAPEPAAWALMFVGVGLAGGALRLNRRSGSAVSGSVA